MTIRKKQMHDIKTKMHEALDSPAVLKMKLIKLKSKIPNTIVLAFEGVEDKAAYYHWMRQLTDRLEYIPFICGGKRKSLNFLNSLNKDVNGLGDNVYFFIDKDFDGCSAITDKIYMTNTYSFENFLASPEVLREILKNDFHCHDRPDIIGHVEALYFQFEEEFFNVVREINFILFIAAMFGIRRIGKLPERMGALAAIEINGVQSKICDVYKLAKLERNPTEEEKQSKLSDFEKLNPKDSYRGKFNLMFFKKFIEVIYLEIKNPTKDIFKDVLHEDLTPTLNLTVDSIASRSRAPKCLSEFVERNFSMSS